MRAVQFCTRTLHVKLGLMLIAAVAIPLMTVSAARAAYTINVLQAGPDVVATGSGSLNFTDLVHLIGPTLTARLTPSEGELLIGPTTGQSLDFYKTISGPSAFGPGDGDFASSGSGGLVGITLFSSQTLVVPAGYVSGTDLGTSTATFGNHTFSNLGLTPGTYVYTLPHDTFTINIGPVPEPASLSLLALAGVTLLRRR